MKPWTLIALLMCSCQGPITYVATNGQKTETFKTWGMVGGSESFRTAGGFEWTGNRTKSFGQAMQAAGLAVGAYQAVKVNGSNNALSATQNTNATQQAINASNNAVKEAAIKATPTIIEPPQQVIFPP